MKKTFILFFSFFLVQVSFSQTELDAIKETTTQFFKVVYSDINAADSMAKSAYRRAKGKYPEQEALALKEMGIVQYFTGNSNQAMKYYQQSKKIYEEISDSSGVAKNLNNIAILLMEQGKLEDAATNYFEALKIQESRHDTLEMIKILSNIATIYRDLHEHETSYKYLLQASQYADNLDDKRLRMNIAINIGSALKEMKQYTESAKYTQLGLKIASEIGDSLNMAIALTNMGNDFFYKEKFDSSLHYHLQAKKIAKRMQNAEVLIGLYEFLGDDYFALKQDKKGLEYFDKAIKLITETQLTQRLLFVYERLHYYYLEHNHLKEAIRYMDIYYKTKDSLLTIEKNSVIRDLEVKHETQKKERAIQQLTIEKQQQQLEIESQRRNWIIAIFIAIIIIVLAFVYAIVNRIHQKQKRIELNRKNIEIENKLLRTQMNPHFLFNSLNSVQNFILKNNTEQACNYLANFSELIRSILENSRYTFIPLDDEIEMLEKYLTLEQLRFKEKFDYVIEIDSKIETSELSVPPMIIQPFVENAIIHGLAPKEGKGEIKVILKQSENSSALQCLIIDNGIGRDAAANIKKPKQGKSLGMLVTRERLAQFNADYNLKTPVEINDLYTEGKPTGTRVSVIIPIK